MPRGWALETLTPTEFPDVRLRFLLDFVDNVRPGARSEDLLYELILKTGLELNVAIEAKAAAGGTYHRIGDGALIICLADKLTEPLLAAMLQDKPERIIVPDWSFANNDQLKTNILLQAEQLERRSLLSFNPPGMKLKFQADQAHQLEACQTIVGIFEGQPMESGDLPWSSLPPAGSCRIS